MLDHISHGTSQYPYEHDVKSWRQKRLDKTKGMGF
jgi:hypothetical protein